MRFKLITVACRARRARHRRNDVERRLAQQDGHEDQACQGEGSGRGRHERRQHPHHRRCRSGSGAHQPGRDQVERGQVVQQGCAAVQDRDPVGRGRQQHRRSRQPGLPVQLEGR